MNHLTHNLSPDAQGALGVLGVRLGIAALIGVVYLVRLSLEWLRAVRRLLRRRRAQDVRALWAEVRAHEARAARRAA